MFSRSETGEILPSHLRSELVASVVTGGSQTPPSRLLHDLAYNSAAATTKAVNHRWRPIASTGQHIRRHLLTCIDTPSDRSRHRFSQRHRTFHLIDKPVQNYRLYLVLIIKWRSECHVNKISSLIERTTVTAGSGLEQVWAKEDPHPPPSLNNPFLEKLKTNIDSSN